MLTRWFRMAYGFVWRKRAWNEPHAFQIFKVQIASVQYGIKMESGADWTRVNAICCQANAPDASSKLIQARHRLSVRWDCMVPRQMGIKTRTLVDRSICSPCKACGRLDWDMTVFGMVMCFQIDYLALLILILCSCLVIRHSFLTVAGRKRLYKALRFTRASNCWCFQVCFVGTDCNSPDFRRRQKMPEWHPAKIITGWNSPPCLTLIPILLWYTYSPNDMHYKKPYVD